MDQNDKNRDELKNNQSFDGQKEDKGMNPLLAGALGVAAGAAAYALTKKENQDKIKKAASDMKKNLDQKMQDVKGGLASKADQAGDKLKKMADDTKKGIDQAQTKAKEELDQTRDTIEDEPIF